MQNDIKNPLAELDEDISRMPIQLSFFEKLGLSSIIFIFIGILSFTSYSLIVDVSKLHFLFILIDVIVLGMCFTAIYFVYNILRKKIVTEALVDMAFQYGVYSRLEGVISNIAQAQVGNDVIMDRLDNIDTKVENILKERKAPQITEVGKPDEILQTPVALGTSLIFMIKLIFMTILTMAIFMFLVNFDLGIITPYSSLIIFVFWWLFITNEYSLWKETGTWTFVFFPIIVVPVMVVIISNFMNYNVMMALLYVMVGLYVILYYIWAIYTTTGSLPFVTKRSTSVENNEFFGTQKKGMFKELIKETKSRFEEK